MTHWAREKAGNDALILGEAPGAFEPDPGAPKSATAIADIGDDHRSITALKAHSTDDAQIFVTVLGDIDAAIASVSGWTELLAAEVVGSELRLSLQRGESKGWPATEQQLKWAQTIVKNLRTQLQNQLREHRRARFSTAARWAGERARIEALEAKVQSMQRSARYKLGHALVLAGRNPKDALRLPKRLGRLAQERVTREDEDAVSPRALALHQQWKRFVEHSRRSSAPEIVLMFSGTTFIQALRANRPIRLTRLLLERGIPTVFSYHGTLDEKVQPSFQHKDLFEAPIEFTKDILADIARTNFGDKKRILIVSYPHLAIARQLGVFEAEGWGIVYDCRDDWEEFAAVGMANWYARAIEEFVATQVDQTFCVSGPLRDKLQTMSGRRPVGVSANAYDPKFLTPGWHTQRTDEAVIGYFGHLSERWFDWESLAEIARSRPNYTFEIIGHMGPAAEPDLPSNVTLLGPKTHPEICEIARRWRVGIIPFRVGPLADAVDPIKIYEYFALQLPVVSFRMPQIDTYPYTTTVESSAAFAQALDDALKLSLDLEVFEEFLKNNRWEHRVDQLLEAGRAALSDKAVTKTWTHKR